MQTEKCYKTEKLYEKDSYLSAFSATVLSCREGKSGYEILLDRTAFFPEEGGQTADTGTLGDAAVTDVRLMAGEIVHITDKPLAEGSTVGGEIDFPVRFRKMQNHTAEHMFSGICHRMWGVANVGFHLGSRDVTVDFDRELSRECLMEAERQVNAAILRCLPVTAEVPPPEVLAATAYRSKLALTEGVRLVTVGDVDVCACCAPHVKNTGEIGLFKVLEAIRYKGGVRVHVKAGWDALEDYDRRFDTTWAAGALLSAPSEEFLPALERLLEENRSLAFSLRAAKKEALIARLSGVEKTEGNLLWFEEEADGDLMQAAVNLLLPKADGLVAVFAGKEGAYRFCIGSRTVDLSAASRPLLSAIGGKGGGSREMLRGSSSATRAQIEEFFADFRSE